MSIAIFRNGLRFQTIALAAATILGACTQPGEPTVSPQSAAQAARVPRALRPHGRGIEDVFLRLERTVPGFGGFFKDSSGTINVFVRGADHRSAAIAAVAAWAQADADALGAAKPAPIIAREGQFAFSELVAWQGQIYDSATPADGIELIDADEAHNRVRVMVRTADGLPRIAHLAASLGIPQTALMAEVGTFDVKFTGNVQTTRFRPQIPAGVRTAYPFGNVNEICTLGFNVRVNGAEHFLTAGHCTLNFQGLTGQAWHQPTPNNPIGSIVINPAWNTTICGSGITYCRETDAALGAYAFGVRGDFKVAETSTIGTGNNPGNLTTGAYWTMLGPRRDFPREIGDLVYKTGQTTGTTSGPVLATCVYTNPDIDFHASVFCAHVAQMDDQPGDSGAPVYYFLAPYNPDLRIPEGIAFGQATTNGQHVALYSTWAQLEADLGVTMDPAHP